VASAALAASSLSTDSNISKTNVSPGLPITPKSTILHSAISCKQTQIATDILKLNSTYTQLNAIDNVGCSVLHYCCMYDSIDLVDLIVENTIVATTEVAMAGGMGGVGGNQNGNTANHQNGSNTKKNAKQKSPVKPKPKAKNNNTNNVNKRRVSERVSKAVERFEQPSPSLSVQPAQRKSPPTIIDRLASSQKVAFTRFLHVDGEGKTALHWSCFFGFADICEKLLSFNTAMTQIENANSQMRKMQEQMEKSMLQESQGSGKGKSAAAIKNKVIKTATDGVKLIKSATDKIFSTSESENPQNIFHIQDKMGNTILHTALSRGHEKISRCILENIQASECQLEQNALMNEASESEKRDNNMEESGEKESGSKEGSNNESGDKEVGDNEVGDAEAKNDEDANNSRTSQTKTHNGPIASLDLRNGNGQAPVEIARTRGLWHLVSLIQAVADSRAVVIPGQ
jgi:ankyrin repeat protein